MITRKEFEEDCKKAESIYDLFLAWGKYNIKMDEIRMKNSINILKLLTKNKETNGKQYKWSVMK